MPPDVSNLIAALTTLVSSLNEQSGVPNNLGLNEDPRFNSDKTRVKSDIYIPIKLGEIEENDRAWNTISKIFAKTQLSAPSAPEPVISPAVEPVLPAITEVVKENNISLLEKETIITSAPVAEPAPSINSKGLEDNFNILSNILKGMPTVSPQPVLEIPSSPVTSPIVNLQSPEVSIPAGPDLSPFIDAINRPVAPPIVNLQSTEALVAPPIVNLQSPEAPVAPPIVNLQSPEAPVAPPIVNLQSPEVPVASPIVNLQSPEAPVAPPIVNLQSPEVSIPAGPDLSPFIDAINRPVVTPIVNLQSPEIPSFSFPDINLSDISGIMQKNTSAPIINLESPKISLPPGPDFTPIFDAINRPAASSIINSQSSGPINLPTTQERLVLPANLFSAPEINIDSVAESISNIKLPEPSPSASFSINDGSVDILKNISNKISQTPVGNNIYPNTEFNGEVIADLISGIENQKPLPSSLVSPQLSVVAPSREMPAPALNIQIPKQDTTYLRGTYEELKVQTQLLSKIADKTGVEVPQASNTTNSTLNQSMDNPPIGVPIFSSTRNSLLNFDIVGQTV